LVGKGTKLAPPLLLLITPAELFVVPEKVIMLAVVVEVCIDKESKILSTSVWVEKKITIS